MSVVFKILIILGIIILVVVFAILILLLIPFKYEFNSNYQNKGLNVSFKYFIISIFAHLKLATPVEYNLKILNKVLFDSSKKKSTENNEKKSYDLEKKNNSIAETDFIKDKELEKNIKDSDKIIKDLFVSAKKYESEDAEKENSEIKVDKDNVNKTSLVKEKEDKVNVLLDKIDGLIPHDMVYVLKKIYAEVKVLLKKILPRNYNVNIKYGVNDPFIYGISYAIFAPILGMSGEKVNLTPSFGQGEFNSKIDASRRVSLFIFVKPLLKLISDNKFRKIVFKK